MSTVASDTVTPVVSLAERVIARCREIAEHTEVPGQITRTFLSPPMHAVHALFRTWMEAAGMVVTIDAVGNLRGLLAGHNSRKRRVIIGSHLDTVPDGGAFDGVLGVVMAVALVESIREPLPFDLEVIGFSEEEGVRFQKPFLGSLALVGKLDAATLSLTDTGGTTVAEAIRHFGLDPNRLTDAKLHSHSAAYLEFHIEQGPVLESLTAPGIGARQRDADPTRRHLGVVDVTVGQSRLLLEFKGQANHAGTTPMHLRHDALTAAAEWMLATESLARDTSGLVATVGQLHTEPGAGNVIPGYVRASLDVRHANDAVRLQAVADLLVQAASAAGTRGVTLTHQTILDQPAVPLDSALARLLETCIIRAGHTPHRMPSGAGHDAMILAPHLPSVMLFLPSPGGLSHHPLETVHARDIHAALETALEFLRAFSHHEVASHA